MASLPHTPENHNLIRDFMGPHHVDQTIRQAISMCWVALPSDKKSVANVEAEIRRLVDRAIQNMREDAGHFGFAE